MGKRCQSNLSGKDEARCTHRCPLTQHLFASDVLAPANSAKKKKKKRHTFLPQAIILPQIGYLQKGPGTPAASLRCEKHSDVDD